VLYVSDAFSAIWGIPATSLDENPMAWTVSIVEEDRARVARNFLLHAAEGQYNEEYRIVRPDGQVRWIHDRRFPIRNEEGQVYRVAGHTEDVTPQKVAQQALQEAKLAAEQANQAKDQFLASLSHELRTPLTPALLATTALDASGDLPSSAHEQVAIIRNNIQAEVRIIDHLLDLTRIAAGKLTLHRRPVDVHGVIRAAIVACESDLQSKPLRLDVELQATSSWAIADPERLQQVFWNLLRNAAKFTPAGGDITIRSSNIQVEGQPAPLICEVCDTGIGMDEKMRDQLFKAFQQAPQSNAGASQGLGLGLALSQAIIHLHGGAILGESDGLGKGSRFTVTLQTTEPLPSSATPPTTPSTPALDHLRLLLVEDHIPTARIIQRILRDQGHSVIWAPDVASAKQCIESHEFDLLLSDVGLADGSGLDLIAPFRQRFNRPGIAISGFGTDQDIHAALQAGFSAHLLKPVDIERLKTTLAMVVAQYVPASAETATTSPTQQTR
jgi:PAS domain S-box-containing protein